LASTQDLRVTDFTGKIGQSFGACFTAKISIGISKNVVIQWLCINIKWAAYLDCTLHLDAEARSKKPGNKQVNVRRLTWLRDTASVSLLRELV